MVPDTAPYMSLETFRNSGAGVATPVWFAVLDGAYWVFSESKSGKVKRLRNSSAARIAVCDLRGNVTGPWVEASATLGNEPDAVAAAHGALRAKYGWQMRFGDVYARITGRIHKRRYIRVLPNVDTAGFSPRADAAS
ncbi:MAG: PPOX class F420-dependent oxidoreductase [Gammaproteobacteria bacterium]